jgi:hypothetical protein
MKAFNIKEDKPLRDVVKFQFFEYEDDIVAIEILEGPFNGLRYYYGNVSPRDSDGGLVLDFDFTVISGDEERTDINDPQMRKVMGDVLVDILMKRV